jgi:hypothetical protein
MEEEDFIAKLKKIEHIVRENIPHAINTLEKLDVWIHEQKDILSKSKDVLGVALKTGKIDLEFFKEIFENFEPHNEVTHGGMLSSENWGDGILDSINEIKDIID